MRVMTAVRKDLLNKIVIEHRTDLVNHPYFILFEIQDLDQQSKRPGKKTRVPNAYDNRVKQGCTWTGNIPPLRQAVENIK